MSYNNNIVNGCQFCPRLWEAEYSATVTGLAHSVFALASWNSGV